MQMKKTVLEKTLHLIVDEKTCIKKNSSLDDVDEKTVL